MFLSTFSSQLSKSYLNSFSFKNVNPQLKLLNPSRLLIPPNNGIKTQKVRLALIFPRL